MAGSENLNLPRLGGQAEAAYHASAGRRPAADAWTAARRAGHLSWFVRLSLDEPGAMRRMQGMAGNLHDSPGLDALLPQVLDGALALTGADFGNVQLLDPASGAPVLVTQSGFGSEFTDYFAVVDDGHSVCGRAARDCAQTVIGDVTTDLGFAPHREIAAGAGFRVVQSTPLADSGGRLVGMVSTHCGTQAARPGGTCMCWSCSATWPARRSPGTWNRPPALLCRFGQRVTGTIPGTGRTASLTRRGRRWRSSPARWCAGCLPRA